ncbi:DNA glycosylase [Abortiporus biennis]|nr:DNA glycosylase [Abortiporus biennis]
MPATRRQGAGTALKRPRSPSPALSGPQPPSLHSDGLGEPGGSNKSKKLKLLAEHALASPFPDFPHPTLKETYEIHRILTNEHPDITISASAPTDSNNSAKTCGSVPNVLESLIGTILSQNTSARNSTAAKRSLDQTFGRNNFEAIAMASKAELVESIKMGGLANKKADVIQNILKEVKQRYGVYSLQHLAGVIEGGKDAKGKGIAASDEEAMKELVSYNGVGPKTASCVLLFCLGRSSFPVDTHVFRLTRLLGWVPDKADRVTAQAHLDLKIPDELKYGLHVLMVGHGRRCKGCKAGKSSSKCVLKDWLKMSKGIKEEERLETINDPDELVKLEETIP